MGNPVAIHLWFLYLIISLEHRNYKRGFWHVPAAGPRRELTERPISDVPQRTQPELPIPVEVDETWWRCSPSAAFGLGEAVS